MAEALLSRSQELERTLQGKRDQGYRIESHDDAHAVSGPVLQPHPRRRRALPAVVRRTGPREQPEDRVSDPLGRHPSVSRAGKRRRP
jgi:hypothetical protein